MQDGFNLSVIPDQLLLAVRLSLNNLLDIVLSVPQLLKFLSLDDEILHILLVQPFLGLDQLGIGFQLVLQLMQLLDNPIIALLGCINILLSFSVELRNLRVNQFQLLYFSLDVKILVFLALDGQFDVVDHLFVLSDIELQF